MHLIHKLRRSISHRPRHLFDLPDEILCLILEYCCQDLDFLLWSCPLVTLENQFCHDCFHCTFCHGPATVSVPLRHTRSRTGQCSTTVTNHRQGQQHNRSTDSTFLRKRRKRFHDRSRIVLSSSSGKSISRTRTSSDFARESSSTQGARPCPRNGNRPWCHHHELYQIIRTPVLWRLFPRSLLSSGFASLPSIPLRSLQHIQPPVKLILDNIVQLLGSLAQAVFFSKYQHQGSGDEDEDEGGSSSLSVSYGHLPPRSSASTSASTSAPWHINRSSLHSSGPGFASNSSALHRRRTMNLNGQGTEFLPRNTLHRLWSARTTTQELDQNQQQGRTVQLELSSDGSTVDYENEEYLDNFDKSIHLPGPFQLLLTNQRFADAAVQSLWRNLVFHGHDPYQMQALLSTLYKDDGSNCDSHPVESEKLGGMKKTGERDEAENGEEWTAQYSSEDHVTESHQYSGQGSMEGSDGEQGPCTSWIDSLNNSLKRFSRFQGIPGVYNTNTGSTYQSKRRYTTVGLDTQRNGGEKVHTQSRRSYGFHEATGADRARWSYRRHVRRVVLNFAHPQASPQMLVKVLECIGSRCQDQIQALDLHANEKMQDAGLEKTAELERLFGSGFTKLCYLRLQGGFVDNQLLCALIKGMTRSAPYPHSALKSKASDGESSYCSHSPESAPTAVQCRLTQVFLGPGSVTDSAVEKLIVAAGQSLEVFSVTSCVDVGGGALASLLTKCPRLRVLGVHRSLARDKDLLEGLGIDLEGSSAPGSQQNQDEQQQQQQHHATMSDHIHSGISNARPVNAPRLTRKAIVAPLERLELGTVKLTQIGIAEILKGTCNTLRFLVLETQHFSEHLLVEVIAPFCTRLEGLHFDDPEHVQRQQQLMHGLGFSAGRRGSHLPDRHFAFGRYGRIFHSDPNRQCQAKVQAPGAYNRRHPHHETFFEAESLERHHPSTKACTNLSSTPTVSAWLGETMTDEWVAFGDCAIWTSAASPAVSFENGGSPNAGGGGGFLNQQPRRRPPPLHHVYHSSNPMMTMTTNAWRSDPTGLYALSNSDSNNNHNLFVGEYDEVLERFRVSRAVIEMILQTLTGVRSFTVMQMDFIMESQGMSEWKMLMRQEELWLQSTGFRVLQLFYVCLFLGTIYFGAVG
ncbi:hypothetical protein BGZ51_000969 [Haplosporangium sp. Z 767]|nr:hypothetical protein BGZ51_000969 [Haplosporangium sp. Z 767]